MRTCQQYSNGEFKRIKLQRGHRDPESVYRTGRGPCGKIDGEEALSAASERASYPKKSSSHLRESCGTGADSYGRTGEGFLSGASRASTEQSAGTDSANTCRPTWSLFRIDGSFRQSSFAESLIL